jgi:hypothetical protein
MNKISKKSIKSTVLSFKILSVLAFSLLVIPTIASADSLIYNGLTVYPQQNYQATSAWQIINSISPSSANRGVNVGNIIITGDGFSPTSVARVNGSNRPTNFIDNAHLMFELNPSDTNRSDGGFYVTVYNNANGGSYSNAAYFTVNSAASMNTVNNNNGYNSANNDYNGNNSSNANQTENTSNGNGYNLASNILFGSNSFLPSGLIQWIIFIIFILLIIILVRRIFGAKQHYEETPLKHE